MEYQRRTFIKGTLAGAATGVAVAAGLLTPSRVLAAWPAAVFEAKDVESALSTLLGSAQTEASGDITVKAPDIAENGAVVPVTISTKMQADSISIVVANNPQPMAATFMLAGNNDGYVSTRIKMGKTSPVIGVVKSGGKLYSARKEVKVTIGGCGG